ncbi:hypothetical protein SME46J_08850 [Serratia marcescens]|uniref:capsular polysaccharide export protein, LipB/KpsS family n=1 Tax=Serratia sp. BFP-2025 TaxID=3433707 RepID=UPI003D7C9F50|nr:hypothetical protein SME46J_08850 [Serratia marcescens]
MTSHKEISICIIDYALAGSFFLRLAASDKNREYIFVSTLLSTYLAAQKKHEAHLISKVRKIRGKDKVTSLPDNRVRELGLNILPLKNAMELASALQSSIRKILDKNKGRRINLLTWNGDNIIGAVMRQAKQADGAISLLFFELSNLKGKIFIDPEGVNAASSIYLKPEVLENIPSVDESVHDGWLKDFFEEKKGNKLLPQASKGKEITLRHLIDFVYTRFLGFQTFPKSSISNRIRKKRTQTISEDKTIPDEYIFFPMQVSTDTQIILNSDVDNVDVLNHLIEKEILPIVTKPHPAESDFDYIYKIKTANQGRLFISQKNTYELIKNAKRVYTINSTVGMESLLFDKNVVFMGRSVYSNMGTAELKKYIHNYLVDIDFFDENFSITPNLIDSVYSRRDNG